MATISCSIADCDNEVSENSQFTECPTCRASINRWKKRGARAILLRRAKLRKYGDRMDLISGPKEVKDTRRKAS